MERRFKATPPISSLSHGDSTFTADEHGIFKLPMESTHLEAFAKHGITLEMLPEEGEVIAPPPVTDQLAEVAKLQDENAALAAVLAAERAKVVELMEENGALRVRVEELTAPAPAPDAPAAPTDQPAAPDAPAAPAAGDDPGPALPLGKKRKGTEG